VRTRGSEAPTPTTGTARLLRVAGLGAASLLLACAAHTLGGGRPPSASVLLVAGIVLGLVAATVTGRRCRIGLLLALLTVEQAVLHLVFDAATSATAAGCGLVSGPTPHHTALGHPLSACAGVPGMSTDMSSLPGPVMLAAHLAATALTALLLAQGERWLWRVADQIIAAATATPARRPRSRQPVPTATNILAGPVARAAAVSRGPPVILVAA
jgi:hypothetical protein